MEAIAARCMQTAELAMTSVKLRSMGSQTWATTSIATLEALPTASRPRRTDSRALTALYVSHIPLIDGFHVCVFEKLTVLVMNNTGDLSWTTVSTHRCWGNSFNHDLEMTRSFIEGDRGLGGRTKAEFGTRAVTNMICRGRESGNEDG